MKKLTTALMCLCLLATAANAQTLKSLFNKYSNDERFEYVSLGKGMIAMAQVFGDADDEEAALLSKIKGLKILTLTDGFDDSLQKEVLKELDATIDAGQFETLMEVRDKAERVNIYSLTNEKGDTDMLVVTKDEAELTLIWFKGKLTAEELIGILD